MTERSEAGSVPLDLEARAQEEPQQEHVRMVMALHRIVQILVRIPDGETLGAVEVVHLRDLARQGLYAP